MARDDDDDRPRKRRARDDADEDDDRPRKSRRSRADEDDEDDDDRPRKSRRSRDDEDDDDDDDRPRKSRRSRDDEDDDEEDDRPSRKKKKKKKKPLPGMLLAVVIVNMIWGGLGTLGGIFNVFSSISELLTNWGAQQLLNIAGLTRGYFISIAILTFLVLIMSIGILGGAIALVLRKGFGKYPVIGCPIGKVIFSLVGIVVGIIFLRGTILLFPLIIAYIVAMVFDTAVCIFNFIALSNDKVKRALD